MADLAAALIMGTALVGLIFWYFRASDGTRPRMSPQVQRSSATGGLPPNAEREATSDRPSPVPASGAEQVSTDRISHQVRMGGHANPDRPSWNGNRVTGPSLGKYEDDDD